MAIAVAPNGARKRRADHPRLPLTPGELAQCAADCLAAGASMLHLHVRDSEGRHSLDPADYRAALDAIRERVGDALLLQVTTEAGGRYAPTEQIARMRELAPQALSISVRELWSDPRAEDAAAAFIAELADRAALVQYIVYDAGDLARMARLHEQGTIRQTTPHVLFVLGSYAARRAGHPSELPPLVGALPAGWPWSACAFGAAELRCVTAAALLGGHVRVGFETNLLLPSGVTATDNGELVRASRDVLDRLGLRRATCAETRRLFRDSREPAPSSIHP
ncbi:MAG: 3-keto-5-aminohexanoate cleavage protein [Casimicrobiaceae bacterium]